MSRIGVKTAQSSHALYNQSANIPHTVLIKKLLLIKMIEIIWIPKGHHSLNFTAEGIIIVRHIVGYICTPLILGITR